MDELNNKICLNLVLRSPCGKSKERAMQELPASTDEDGWGRSFDDVDDVDGEQDDDAVV